MRSSSAQPAVVIRAVLIAAFGLISILHVLFNKPIYFLYYWLNLHGYDFEIFFMAAQNILHGLSPYAVAWNYNRYVYPPIPALATILLVPLGFDTARLLLYVLIPVGVAAGFLALSSAFNFAKEIHKQVLWTGLACMLFGYPFYFLLHGENIDGWVFLFLCLGFYFSEKAGKYIWSGLFLSLAIMFKIYPVLILVPLVLYRKWRPLTWTGAWLAIGAGISAFWRSGFRSSLAGRLTDFQLSDNGSLYATMLGFQNLFGALGREAPAILVQYPTEIAAVIYAVLFLTVVAIDYQLARMGRYDPAAVTMYVPFMLAWPRTVYPYAFLMCLILIPAVTRLWAARTTRAESITIMIISIGIVLSQWQSYAWYNLTGSELCYAIPGLGLLILMGGIAVYKSISLGLALRESLRPIAQAPARPQGEAAEAADLPA